MKKQILNLGSTLSNSQLKSIKGEGRTRVEFCARVCARSTYYPEYYYVRCGCA